MPQTAGKALATLSINTANSIEWTANGASPWAMSTSGGPYASTTLFPGIIRIFELSPRRQIGD